MLTRNKHGRICVDGRRLRPLHAPGRKRESEGRAGAEIKTDCSAGRRIGTAGQTAERTRDRVGSDEAGEGCGSRGPTQTLPHMEVGRPEGGLTWNG